MIKKGRILFFVYFIILFGLIELFRDIFVLPLFGVRLYYINFSFLFFLTSIIFLNKHNLISRVRNIKPKYIYYIFFFIPIFLFLQFFKNDSDYFYLLQITSASLSILFSILLVRGFGIQKFIKNFSRYSFFVVFVMSVIWILWFLEIGNLIDAKTRNSLPYLMLGLYYLMKSLKQKNHFLVFFFILCFICETRGAILIYLLCLVSNYFLKFINNKNKLIIYKISIILIVFFPILSIFLVKEYLNIDFAAFKELENYRYYINDDIASLISRNAGAGYILINNLSEIFPLGSYNLSKIDSFWGYPTHNYLYYSIMKYGIFGCIFVFFLIKITYKVMLYNFNLGLIFIYCLTNFNDFYIGFLIFLIPLFIEDFKIKFTKKKSLSI
jgi:hypothetical protein